MWVDEIASWLKTSWWKSELMRWLNDEMASRWNLKLTKFQVGEMSNWWNCKGLQMVRLQNGNKKLTCWWNCKLIKLWVDEMEIAIEKTTMLMKLKVD